MVLIIYCHPSRQSHNGSALKRATETLSENKIKYELLDLYEMDFECCLKPIEYTRMRKHERKTEKDVTTIQQKITDATHLMFIYPTWWYNMPAKLKGFMDRVFTSGFAYRFFPVKWWQLLGANVLSFIPGLRYFLQPYSATPKLKGKRAIIFRTYGGPALGRRMFGNTPTVLENVILRFCGITDITIRELYNVDKPDVFKPEDEEAYLDQIKEVCKNLKT